MIKSEINSLKLFFFEFTMESWKDEGEVVENAENDLIEFYIIETV